MRQILTIISLLATALAGCSGQNVPFVYKIDIPQGNIVTQEMLSQLKRGMDKQRVTYIMGTPLLMDVFHQDRWDYLYSFKPGRGEREQRRISLFFQDGRLDRIEGDIKTSGENLDLTEAPGTPSAQKPSGQQEAFVDGLMDQLGVESEDTAKPVPTGK